MSTIFTTNPVRVNLISLNNTIKQTIVFIGIVPNNVKSELLKIEKTTSKNIKNENPILSKFYGRDWMMKLGIGGWSSKSIKKGGDEFSFDDTGADADTSADTGADDASNELNPLSNLQESDIDAKQTGVDTTTREHIINENDLIEVSKC